MAEKNAKEIEQLRKNPKNKECMDCREKGATYIVTNLGIFVCSRCAGLHREIHHKVKGINMCTFSNEEVNLLKKWGNENAAKVWLATFKSSYFSEESMRDIQKLKEYMRSVYVQKRYYKEAAEEKNEEDESESESSSEDDKKSPVEKPKPEKKENKGRAKAKEEVVQEKSTKPAAKGVVDLLNFSDDENDKEPKNNVSSTSTSTSSTIPWANVQPAPVSKANDLTGLSLNSSEQSKPVQSKAPNPTDPLAVFSNPAPTPALPRPPVMRPLEPQMARNVPPQLLAIISQHMNMFCQQYRITPQQYASVVNKLTSSMPMYQPTTYMQPPVYMQPRPVTTVPTPSNNPFEFM